MQQGRVQTDSDWNEWLLELSRRMQAGTLDTVGRSVYPQNMPSAFQITAQTDADGNHILIGPGRMYVDGLLAENHGDPTTAVWDPALAELSNTPQPTPSTPTTPPAPGSIDYAKQPHLPNPPAISGNGPFLAYLDVWTRPVTYIEDSNLIDPAIGVDTSGRLQTVWQVKLMPSPSGSPTCPESNDWWPASSAGLITTGPVASSPSGPCCLTSPTGYTGQENQLYRVEIHQAGAPSTSPATSPIPAGTATFKWSRDNGSVMTAVTAVGSGTNSKGQPTTTLSVVSLGRDQVLCFANGDWIELIDDSLQLSGAPGHLCRIDTVQVATNTITLVASLPASYTFNSADNPRIIRWDQSGKVYLKDGNTVWWDPDANGATGDIPVPPSGTVLILENGITVAFDLSSPSGSFLTDDFWAFAARTADGSIQALTNAPPMGPHHHYAALSVVSFSPNSNTDCRTPWNPLSGTRECGCCCTYTVGKGGQYSSINAAIQALPTTGGEICILPGIHYENVFIQGRQDIVLHGCGRQTIIASASLNPNPASTPAPPEAGATSGGASAASTFTAVITVSGSTHVRLESFYVVADTEDVGILLDGTGNLSSPAPSTNPDAVRADQFAAFESVGVVDTTIKDLVITASQFPAFLAQAVEVLEVDQNRIAMKNVRCVWPAVQVSGKDIFITRNWIGLEDGAGLSRFPASVIPRVKKSPEKPMTSSGIQIAGFSENVSVVENRIEDCGFNGITLGSYSVLNANGNDTGLVVGLRTVQPGERTTADSLTPGGPPSNAPSGSTVVAGGRLVDIQIDRNFIRNTQLCGIGPVGFFDLRKMLEVVSIERMTIASNTIASALQGDLAVFESESAFPGYGAICVPDVEALTIRDNLLLNFGAQPGLKVCGIYVFLGEMVEISRNQILETRDWTSPTQVTGAPSFGRGGISVFATPPTFKSGSPYTRDGLLVYEPGLPALRIDSNIVRVPLSKSLSAIGFGPFSVVNNHFACGGGVTDTGVPLAQTVLILNMGTAIETSVSTVTYSDYYRSKAGTSMFQSRSMLSQSSGAVMFTSNVCQLEGQSINQTAYTNVMI